tara:strand:+ start:55 stop:771 length:717 start_codon:yes stop_codon:yes gene_type:complete
MFYDLKSTTYRIVDMMQAVTTVDLRDRAPKFSGLGDRVFISSPLKPNKGTSKSRTMADGLDTNKLMEKVVADGDKEAFSQLYSHFAPRIKAMMMKMSPDSSVAEEVAQEAMIALWRKAYSFDPNKASLSTWLFTIARNLRIDRFRAKKKDNLDPNEPMLLPSAEPSAEETVFREEESIKVRSCISKLPEDQQEVVGLAFMEGMTHQEIADNLGIPLGTVKSRLRLSFEKLRPMLKELR